MRVTRSAILSLVVLLLTVPRLRAQDFSNYRSFSLGTSLETVLKLTNQKLTDVNVTHAAPVLFQEVTWWPPSTPGAFYPSDSIEQILFSFYNGKLYKMSVTYDQDSTEGLTAVFMIDSISAKYGPPATIISEADTKTKNQYEVKQRPVATWEDSQSSFTLVRSSFTDRFGLVVSSKRVSAEAELAIAEAAKLDELERPKREAERQKKKMDDLEVARQKNQKSFRP